MAEPRSPRRQPRPSAVPRAVLQTIDSLERKVAFALSALGFAVSALSVYIIYFVKPTTTYFVKPKKIHVGSTTTASCPRGFHASSHAHHVITMCSRTKLTPASQLWINFAVLFAASLLIYIAAQRKRRTFIVVACLFMGLALGTFSIGLPFVAGGVWLMWRAWRLQRYGVASFSGVSQITRQRALDRREGRTPAPIAIVDQTPAKSSTPDSPRRVTEPSKRYTPKKPPRKKR